MLDSPVYEMGFGKAENLSVFEQYRFFTPALLFIHGRFNARPLEDFLSLPTTPKDCKLLYHKFQKPIFDFPTPDGDRDWDHVIWAIDVNQWKAFEDFVLSVTLVDAAAQVVYRVGSQDRVILDPLTVDAKSILSLAFPRLAVTVFGVDATDGIVALEPPQHLTLRPKARFYKAQPRNLLFAKAVFSGDNPNAYLPITGNKEYGDIPPIDFKTKPIESFDPARQEDFAKSIREYKQTFNEGKA